MINSVKYTGCAARIRHNKFKTFSDQIVLFSKIILWNSPVEGYRSDIGESSSNKNIWAEIVLNLLNIYDKFRTKKTSSLSDIVSNILISLTHQICYK